MTAGAHDLATASAWVQRWSHLVRAGASVLDVACGSGRHVRWFAQRGCRVTGVDRDVGAMRQLEGLAELCVADIERGPWPFTARRFDAVVVTNYLWRERLPDVIGSLGEAGVLIYETFGSGNETVGKPSNPMFLLRPGELLEATRGLRVVAYEDGFECQPKRFVQRIVAVREGSATTGPARHVLRHRPDAPGQVKSADSEDPP